MNRADVYLAALSDAEFVDYRRQVIDAYAEESVAADRVPEEGASEWAQRETDRLLPDGNHSSDTYIFKIVSRAMPNEILGYLWSGRDRNNPRNAFIYDVQVLPAHRRQGVAAAALRQLETFLKARGYRAVGLHVYAANETAHALYRKSGYTPSSHVLKKEFLP